jgi:rhamnogalacturonyl hydrolase YesR
MKHFAHVYVFTLTALVCFTSSLGRENPTDSHEINANTIDFPNPIDVLAAMNAANNYFTGNNPSGDCGWTRGTYFAGSISHYQRTCDTGTAGCNKTLLTWIETWAEGHNFSCSGSINANDEACGQTYLHLYELSKNKNALNLRYTLDKQVNNHTFNGDWNWVDALFMALPTFVRFANVTGDTSYLLKAWELYNFTAYIDGPASNGHGPGLWWAPDGLFFRDASYFKQVSPNGKPVFWARGNGWAMAALARALSYLDSSPSFSMHFIYTEFENKLVSMANALLPLQGVDGMWRTNLLDAEQYPNHETTGTSLYTHAIASGINQGILDKATFSPVVSKAWTGLSTLALQPNGLVGFCQPVGAAPGNTTATSTSDFCVGQFLLAGDEVIKLYR